MRNACFVNLAVIRRLHEKLSTCRFNSCLICFTALYACFSAANVQIVFRSKPYLHSTFRGIVSSNIGSKTSLSKKANNAKITVFTVNH